MSLPFCDCGFAALLACAEGLRIGFLPDMGVGLTVQPDVRAAAEAAATAPAGAGCHVESIRSFLTEEMLDGMCRFFEARSYHDLMNLSAGKREKVLPFVAEWCSWRAAHFSGRDVMQAYAHVVAMRDARRSPPRSLRLHPVAGLADRCLRGRVSRAGQRFARCAAAHRFHGAVQHVGAARGLGQLEHQRRRPADRRAGDRQTVRRCRGARLSSLLETLRPKQRPGRSSSRAPPARGRPVPAAPAPRGSCGWR